MTRVLAIAALILTVVAAPASGQQALAPADYARVNAALVETHAVPRYERLSTATVAFAAAAQALCEGTSDAGITSVRDAFHGAMDAWMGVQHLRFGPIESFKPRLSLLLLAPGAGKGGRCRRRARGRRRGG